MGVSRKCIKVWPESVHRCGQEVYRCAQEVYRCGQKVYIGMGRRCLSQYDQEVYVCVL